LCFLWQVIGYIQKGFRHFKCFQGRNSFFKFPVVKGSSDQLGIIESRIIFIIKHEAVIIKNQDILSKPNDLLSKIEIYYQKRMYTPRYTWQSIRSPNLLYKLGSKSHPEA
jgi:hypothetical protein